MVRKKEMIGSLGAEVNDTLWRVTWKGEKGGEGGGREERPWQFRVCVYMYTILQVCARACDPADGTTTHDDNTHTFIPLLLSYL